MLLQALRCRKYRCNSVFDFADTAKEQSRACGFRSDPPPPLTGFGGRPLKPVKTPLIKKKALSIPFFWNGLPAGFILTTMPGEINAG